MDLYNLPGAAEDVHLAWKRVQDESPDVYYTPRYGGYWVVTRAELLEQLWPDFERFSSANGAIAIPRVTGMPSQLPIESDPPIHRFFRRPLDMALAPKAVQALTIRARWRPAPAPRLAGHLDVSGSYLHFRTVFNIRNIWM